MSDSTDGTAADGAGAELERLHLEWQQLEQRRSRLSVRSATSSASLHSRIPPPPSLDPGLHSNSNRSGLNGTSPIKHQKLEEEREALRLALSRGRSGASTRQRNPLSLSHGTDDNERAGELERDGLRAKVATIEQDNNQLQSQLAEYQKQTEALQRRLEEQHSIVSDLTAGLQRSEAGAKHSKEMLTQINDKQQASMLVLQREKGALERQLSSLKEDNDSLRARTNNMMLNSQESENMLKAQKAAASVLHAKDREGLEEDVQALRLQSAVALQQLKDKSQEVCLAAHEVRSLRDQMEFLTSEVQGQKQKTADAEARAHEAEVSVSKMLMDRMSSARKHECMSVLAASTVFAGRLRRWLSTLLQRWSREAAWTRYHRMHASRMQRRSQRQRLFKHFSGWLDLIRQTKRYERLGYGVDGLRRRTACEFIAVWRRELWLSRILRVRQSRHDHCRRDDAIDAWKQAVCRKKRMQQLCVRSFLNWTMTEFSTILSKWLSYVRSRKEKFKNCRVLDVKFWIHSVGSAFKVWCSIAVEHRRNRLIIQKCSRLIASLDERAVFDKWSNATKTRRHNRTIMRNALFGTELMRKHLVLDEWRRESMDLRVLRRFCVRMGRHSVYSAFQGWLLKIRLFQKHRGLMGRALSRTEFMIKVDAMDEFKRFARTRRIARRVTCSMKQLGLHAAFSTWAEGARGWSAQIRAMRHKVKGWYCRICFRAWCQYRSFKSWTDRILPHLLTRTDVHVLTDSWNLWAAVSKDLKILRRVVGAFLKLKAKKAFHTWQDVCDRAQVLDRRLWHMLQRWFFKTLRGCFQSWHQAHVLIRATRCMFEKWDRDTDRTIVGASFHNWCRFRMTIRVTRHVLTKYSHKYLAKAVKSWASLCAHKAAFIKSAETAFMKLFWKSTRGAFQEWLFAICKRRKLRAVVRRFRHLLVCRAFDSWCESALMEKHKGKDLASKLEHRQIRHVVSVWRRALVVERIFRQRVYNLLPSMAAKHDRLHLRRFHRAWQAWSRHGKSLSVRLDSHGHVCRRRLAGAAFAGMLQHLEQSLASNRVAELGIRAMSRCADKLVVARMLWHWMIDLRATREKALLEDRVITTTCGNALRCWALHSICSRGYRRRLHMVRKIARRKCLQHTFFIFANVIKGEKREAHIILCCRMAHTRRLAAESLACIREFTANGRALGLALARKKRLHKSRLLQGWQQAASLAHLAVTFDDQQRAAFEYCARQRVKRGARQVLRHWIDFLQQQRLWNKFLARVARKRLSSMMHAWHAFFVVERLHDRAMRSTRRRWMFHRLHEWRNFSEDCNLHNHARIVIRQEGRVRAMMRGWARATTRRQHKLRFISRLVRRRQLFALRKAWGVWAGTESKKGALRMVVRHVLGTVRHAFLLWCQASLLVPAVSVCETLNRLPHRALLAYILKQWRYYCRKIQRSMFKYHPQFRLAKAWGLWHDLRRRLVTATCIADAVNRTAHFFNLSSILRQWLQAVIEPASVAEEALRNKWGRMKLLKFFAILSQHVTDTREIMKARNRILKDKMLRVAFSGYRTRVAYLNSIRSKNSFAIERYTLNLLAVHFFFIRDEVLASLLVDESVHKIVREKTYTVFLRAGFVAFFDMWQEARILLQRANDYRQQRQHIALLAHAFDVLREESQIRQQQRYSEARSRMQSLYRGLLKAAGFSALCQECRAEKELELRVRLPFEFRRHKQAQNMVVAGLKIWLVHSRAIEEQALRKHDCYLLGMCFKTLLSATRQNVDPALLRQMMRVQCHRQLHHAFVGLVSRLRRRQLLYQAHAQVRRRHWTQHMSLTCAVWQAWALRRKKRTQGLRYLHFRRLLLLCKRTLIGWCSIWLEQVYIGSKLGLLRNRALLLHVKSPALGRWKSFHDNARRLSVAYCRIISRKTVQRAKNATWAWRVCVVDRVRILRKIEGMIFRSDCSACRKCILAWHRSIDKSIKADYFSLSKRAEFCRRHLRGWHAFCADQHLIQERARTYSVIIKSFNSKLCLMALSQAFDHFVSNLFGARFSACSKHRRYKWQHIRALQGSPLRHAFVTWRRHWIEFQQLGEALRRVLTQRRGKVDLRQPFLAMVRYTEDRKNIRRETKLVHKTAKILSDVLDVYGEPHASDFTIRAEYAVTIDDLIVLLKHFHRYHSDLKASAKLANAAPPQVVSHGPLPYSHHVTTVGKKDATHLGLSPPLLLTPNLHHEVPSVPIFGFSGRPEDRESDRASQTTRYLGDSFRRSTR